MIRWQRVRVIRLESAVVALLVLFGSTANAETSGNLPRAPATAPAASGDPPRVLHSAGVADSGGDAAVLRARGAGLSGEASSAQQGDSSLGPSPGDAIEPNKQAGSDAELDQVTDTDPSALQDFSPHLEPHGRWIEHPRLGTVWVPHARAVGSQFAPYVSRGRWALTNNDEWIWQSDYPFGWVTFHYGRWAWADSAGWAWIPGRRYAPAWVSFRVSNSAYLGWSPMPPTYVWRNGVAVGLRTVPPSPYVFVPTDYAFYPSLQSYVIFQHFRVLPLMRRSRTYFPRGARSRYRRRYYSPPLRFIPARARPRGRVRAHPEARRLTRFRNRNSRVSRPTRQVRRTPAQPRRAAAPGRAERATPSRSLSTASSRRSRAAPARNTESPSRQKVKASTKNKRTKNKRTKNKRTKNKRKSKNAKKHQPTAQPSRTRSSRSSGTRSTSRSTRSSRVRATPRRAR